MWDPSQQAWPGGPHPGQIAALQRQQAGQIPFRPETPAEQAERLRAEAESEAERAKRARAQDHKDTEAAIKLRDVEDPSERLLRAHARFALAIRGDHYVRLACEGLEDPFLIRPDKAADLARWFAAMARAISLRPTHHIAREQKRLVGSGVRTYRGWTFSRGSTFTYRISGQPFLEHASVTEHGALFLLAEGRSEHPTIQLSVLARMGWGLFNELRPTLGSVENYVLAGPQPEGPDESTFPSWITYNWPAESPS